MVLKEKEIKLKCVSCGAGLNLESKKCSYCGSINPNYKPKEIKQLNPQQKIFKQARLINGIFTNLFEGFLENFDED